MFEIRQMCAKTSENEYICLHKYKVCCQYIDVIGTSNYILKRKCEFIGENRYTQTKVIPNRKDSENIYNHSGGYWECLITKCGWGYSTSNELV